MQRGCSEKQLAAVFRGPADSLAYFVAWAVGVAEFVGFVDHNEVPSNRFKSLAKAVRVVVRHDQNGIFLKRDPAASLGVAPGLCIEDPSGQVKLLL